MLQWNVAHSTFGTKLKVESVLSLDNGLFCYMFSCLEYKFELLIFQECKIVWNFMQFAKARLIGDSREVKAEYLSCLKHLSSLLVAEGTKQYRGTTLLEMKDEIKSVEHDICSPRRTS